VRSYGWFARGIGHPRAVRAVGTALARNRVPLVVPCHRVVRSDWRLGQYSAGGPEVKRAVLRAEGMEPDVLEELARRGVRCLGNDATMTFCVPTCRNMRRVPAAHRVEFRSEAAALEAGHRPCGVCRPAAPLTAA